MSRRGRELVDADRAISATSRSPAVDRAGHGRRSATLSRRSAARACADPADRRQQCGDPAGRARARPAARQSRPDHARRPFRHARHSTRASATAIRCGRLLEDGLPGANIAQIGLAPFANSAAMHDDAVGCRQPASSRIGDVRRDGIAACDRAGARPCRALRGDGRRFRHRRDRPLAIARGARAPGRAGWRRPISSGRSAISPPIRGCASST